MVLGHSLGGAALGSLVYSAENPFDHSIFYGTSSFIKPNNPSLNENVRISFLFGENQGTMISKPQVIQEFSDEFRISEKSSNGLSSKDGLRTLQVVPELNHFCVISDLTVGDKSRREGDGSGPKPSECAEKLVNFLF